MWCYCSVIYVIVSRKSISAQEFACFEDFEIDRPWTGAFCRFESKVTAGSYAAAFKPERIGDNYDLPQRTKDSLL